MFSFQGVSPKLEYRSLKRKPRQAAEDEGVIPSERSAEEVAPVRRNFNSGKRNCREAEYRNPKLTHGNRREERRKIGTGGTHREGKPGRREKKERKLSSRGSKPDVDERKRAAREHAKGKRRKRRGLDASTCGTAVGARQGRAKGNEQQAE